MLCLTWGCSQEKRHHSESQSNSDRHSSGEGGVKGTITGWGFESRKYFFQMCCLTVQSLPYLQPWG